MNQLLILVVFIFLVFILGYKIGFWSKQKFSDKSIILGIFGLVIFLINVLLRIYPVYEYKIFPWVDYFYYRDVWGYFGFSIVVGILIHSVREERRTFILSLFCVAILAFVSISFKKYKQVNFEVIERGFSKEGICMQSTGYTCGPTTIATLLYFHGIKASESEMAKLCFSHNYTGSHALTIIRGMRLKFPDPEYSIHYDYLSWENLIDKCKKAILEVYYNEKLDHVAVLLEIDDNGVVLGDPLFGIIKKTKSEFLDGYYLGKAYWVEKK